MPRACAFFDMDRTLLRCSTGERWLSFLRRRGEVSLWRTVQALAWLGQYKLSILDMEGMTERLVAEMRGESEREMREKCRQFFADEVEGEVAPRGREAVDFHRSEGHELAILSSSTPYVTEPLAALLDIRHVLCTRLDVEDGRFAGTHVKPACYGAGKVYWAERFAGSNDVDLAASWFYTDSYTDLPMLDRVGVPRVVNPDTRLRRHAQKVGWPVETW
jgi:HAD superfamily hydrolase (TIGR01490 family)